MHASSSYAEAALLDEIVKKIKRHKAIKTKVKNPIIIET